MPTLPLLWLQLQVHLITSRTLSLCAVLILPPSFSNFVPHDGSSHTCCLSCCTTGFPHGLVDDIEGIAHVAKRAGVCLHVDACLGGFVLPFARQLGYQVVCRVYHCLIEH
jgi:hypothetical protein